MTASSIFQQRFTELAVCQSFAENDRELVQNCARKSGNSCLFCDFSAIVCLAQASGFWMLFHGCRVNCHSDFRTFSMGTERSFIMKPVKLTETYRNYQNLRHPETSILETERLPSHNSLAPTCPLSIHDFSTHISSPTPGLFQVEPHTNASCVMCHSGNS